MDPKVIEMNNLRVLNDYLNQTLDVLVRGRNGHTPGIGYSPFAGSIPSAPGAIGTDVVYGQSPFGYAGAPFHGGMSPASFAPTNPFTGLPLYGGGYGAFTAYPQPWGQQPWGQQPWAQQPWGTTPWTAGQWTPGQWPVSEAARQAQVTQTLAAKQSVLEAICRCCGIPV